MGKDTVDFKMVFLQFPAAREGINPLIGEDEHETLKNVHDALATLQQLTIAPLGGELVLDQASTSGLYLLLDAARGAQAYVIHRRTDES